MQDVFFYEAFEEEAERLRQRMPCGVRAGYERGAIGETNHVSPPARLLSIRTQSVIPPRWFDRIEGVLTRSTGFDHLAGMLRRSGRSVPAGYLPLYCHRAVAEQALTLWLALGRKLTLQIACFDGFNRDGLTGCECRGKTLLAVGVGRIGREVLRIGRGLDMTTLGVDICPRHGDVTYVSIEDGLKRADVIVCAMSLNVSNAGYFSRARWRRTKRGAVFVNVARGEMAPCADLVWALDNERLSGVALDVFGDEPAMAEALRAGRRPAVPDWSALDALRRRPNVICTPHNAFNTREAVERKSRQSVEQALHFLKTGCFKWPVPLEPPPH